MDTLGWYWSLCLQFVVVFALVSAQDSVVKRDCPTPLLVNGAAQLRSRGRIVRYKCNRMFRPIGPQYATCLNGAWDTEPPVCVRPGCPMIRPPRNGIREPTFRNAVVLITCDEGYVLTGPRTLFCDGTKWNGTVPTCIPEDREPATFCDFDNDDLCGWRQDSTDDGDWIQNRFRVGNLSLAPQFDHTFGKGFGGRYMYARSQNPRLVSPVYPASLTADAYCFIFWYHMAGVAVGTLRVYQKASNESLSIRTPVSWELQGDQGSEWQQGIASLPSTATSFQIVLEAKRGSDTSSVIAIDDVSLESGSNCSAAVLGGASTPSEVEDPRSCAWRCEMTTSADAECSCSRDCEARANCCSDYWQICVTNVSNATSVVTQTSLSNVTTSVVTSFINTTAVVTSPSTTVVTTPSTTVATRPTTVATRPTTVATRPTTVATRPTTVPTRPTTVPTRPTTIATRPTIPTKPPTTKPSTIATRPSTITTRPTIKPTKITTRPTIKTTRRTTPKPVPTTITTKTTIRSTRLTLRTTTPILDRITPAAVADKELSESNLPLMAASATVACALLLLTAAGVAVLVRRRRVQARARELDSEDSDVRFLTASDGDVQLDFTLATSLT